MDERLAESMEKLFIMLLSSSFLSTLLSYQRMDEVPFVGIISASAFVA